MGDITYKQTHLNDGVIYIRNLILRGMSAIYLVAFITFYYQSLGLFGNNGILPARRFFEGMGSIPALNYKKLTLLNFAVYLGIDTENMMDFLALLGTIISFIGLISQKICVLPTFAALWYLYFSLIQIVQDFGNQSDYLLLEAGFIILILAPLNSTDRSSPSDKLGLVMLRWLLFRFTFDSGAVKLISNCPQWWNFTGISRHFETLPLPTPLSWYSYNLPDSWLKVTNIFTNITELVGCWLFFFPHKTVKQYVFIWQIFLQIAIILTGNYGFLNFLMPVLLLSLLEDEFVLRKRVVTYIFKALGVLTLIYFALCLMFASFLDSWKFTPEYLDILKSTIKPAPLMASVILIATFLFNLVSHPIIIYAKSFVQKMYAVNTLFAYALLSIFLITVSMVPHNNLDTSTNITNTDLGRFYQKIRNYHIVNEYGQHLRKMRTERLEVIYEHSQNIDGPWTEYGFLYKPWNENNSLPFAGPYLARFDFKFYDIAQSSYPNQLWTVSTAYRLLQNEPNVLRLFGINSQLNPNPKFVRASLYKFKYTSYSDGNAYWMRKRHRDYIPYYSLDNATLLAYLRSMKISLNFQVPEIKNKFLKSILSFIRSQVMFFDGSYLILGILSAAFTIIVINKKN